MSDPFRLDGKRAVVTGSASGIGQAIAVALARHGADVAGLDVDAAGLASTHPDFIKCRKIEEIGSLVKKARVCHTNDEWKKLWAQGNQDARDTVDHFGSKASSCPPTRPC